MIYGSRLGVRSLWGLWKKKVAFPTRVVKDHGPRLTANQCEELEEGVHLRVQREIGPTTCSDRILSLCHPCPFVILVPLSSLSLRQPCPFVNLVF